MQIIFASPRCPETRAEWWEVVRVVTADCGVGMCGLPAERWPGERVCEWGAVGRRGRHGKMRRSGDCEGVLLLLLREVKRREREVEGKSWRRRRR